MNNGIHVAYSGMKAQMEALDLLANNLANVNTAGFKEQRTFFSLMNQTIGDAGGQTPGGAANGRVKISEGGLNLQDGLLRETGRDLDVALVGAGFLTVQTDRGMRFTRNGNLRTDARSVLCTSEGHPVLGEQGPIRLGPGKVSITETGEVLLDNQPVERLKLAAFGNGGDLVREGNSLFAPAGPGAQPAAADVSVRQGFLEQSNVNPVQATIRLVEIMRHFEAIQKSLNLMINDLDAKAIARLGR